MRSVGLATRWMFPTLCQTQLLHHLGSAIPPSSAPLSPHWTYYPLPSPQYSGAGNGLLDLGTCSWVGPNLSTLRYLGCQPLSAEFSLVSPRILDVDAARRSIPNGISMIPLVAL